ncbi:hypothetical protein OG413_20325 [Streptomyces sp. NBC_01433]|uniref:hypothetical protein n=1 Tax=Streptomyces sp. NBC_01433 TaxID=2903864 RepID=UPI0022548D23|nr:hypothetical protein [Streptomyces sp. NBC_01433]MCX4677621.1 hypothetical protein [Streptomyces sp. NBC_01433]
MLNRFASSVGLSRALEIKAVRRPWNPALHPRDSKGRFIETGGVARLWSGHLARVVRALPRNRVLVQDRANDGTYTGRRHTTSARWITMVARPDGTAPTKNQDKVEAEDARREVDDRRGLGLSRDDVGDPDTPDEPHDVDDEGDGIGDDEGDAPENDDQDEPEDGDHEVDTAALPNRAARSGARFKDTAAVRQHFLDLAEQPGANASALRRLAGDEDLQVTQSGGLVTTRDDATGRWYLTSTGTGGYLDIGDFTTHAEAAAAADYIGEHVRNGHIMPAEFNQPIDFSDPAIATWFLTWRSTKGEDAAQAIRRAVQDFHAARKNSGAPKAPGPTKQPAHARGRFATLPQARANWTQKAEALRATGSEQDRRTAQDLDLLVKEQRLKLVGDGQFVTRRVEDDWYLHATGNGQQMAWWFDRQGDAQKFAEHIVGALKDKDGNALDFSDPDFAEYRTSWRSPKGRDYHQEWTAARALWDQQHPPKHSIATDRLAETLRRSPFGDNENQAPKSESPAETTPVPDTAEPTEPKPDERPQAQAPSDEETAPVPEGQPAADVPPQETPEDAADGRPAGVPEDAEPVNGVDGYWSTWSSGNVTVYAPDGKQIGRVVGSYGDRHATVGGVHIPIGDSLTQADQIMARHHLASVDPAKADHVHFAWTTHKGKRIIAIRGTIKDDPRDDRAVGAAGKLAWSPIQKARVTGTQWKPETRDRKAAQILAAFAKQGRNVRITDEDAATATADAPAQLDEDTKKLRATHDADLRGQRDNLKMHVRIADTPARKQRARAALQKVEAELDRRRIAQSNESDRDQPEDQLSPQDRAAAMSDTELAEAVSRSERDRGTYGSRRGDRLTADERVLYADRRRRTTEQVAQAGNPQDLSDEDLAAHIKGLEARERAHKPSGLIHEEDDLAPERDLWNDLTGRVAEAETEQQVRALRDIQQRPPVQDLDDDALEQEFLHLPARLRRLNEDQNKVLAARRSAVHEERQDRKAAVWRNGPDPAGLTDEDLSQSFKDLYKARTLTSGREREALDERLKALFDEQNRRGAEGREQTVRRADTRGDALFSTYGVSVAVDGNDYGKITFHERDSPYGAHKAGWNAQRQSHGRGLGAFPSMTEALAAIVDSYDTDPASEPVRLYGSVRRVWVPKMFFELYQSSRRADSFPSASKERQTLYALFKGHGYGGSDGTNPITGKIGKGANLDVPEGLFAEFQRVTEELSREMMLRANDRDFDSSDRSKARTRLASINAALHGINAQRTAISKDGGDDDRKVISREEIEAQQAALRAALGTNEGADGEHLQPDSQEPLDEAPSAGAGGDGRPGAVLPEQGPGDRDGDSGGRGGAGAGRAGGDGVRGPGRSDQADQGERDGSGPARPAAGAGAGGRGAADAQPGDAGSSGAEGLGVRHVAPRFRPNPADAATKGPIQRAAANVEAIRVLKRLQKENRQATDREKVTLARWTGWGSVPVMFAAEPNEKEPRYQQGGARHGKFSQDHARWAEYRELRTMLSAELTPVEWRQASRGTLSMHYTPQPIAEAMWHGLKALGFQRGDVLEAGSGSGTFFGVSPAGARLTGVELDPTTAKIAQALYPDANVLNENFAETDAHPGTFDASIGNVPFASVPFGDKRYPAESLHNGFITKDLALTRPGGITLLITSRHTLDSKGDKARKQIAKYGDLIGAVRLPSGVFNDAGTSVVTDVLVLRRRADGDEPGDTAWLNAPERKIGDVREHVNAYFTEHPEHILGELTTESSPYGPRLTVKGNPAEAADQLRDALEKIAAKAVADGNGYEPHPDGDNRPPVFLQTAREKHANDWTGRLYEGDDGKLYQHVNGGNPVTVEPSDDRTDQLRALMQLRDVAAELRVLDRKNDEDERAEKLRAELRDLHSAYVEKFGPLSKPGQFRSMKTGARPDGTEERTPTAWGYFRSDPDAGSVLALERWDADKQEPVLSRVFTERAAARRQPLSRTDDPKAALAAVVAANGEVDLGEVARLLDMDPQDAVRALGTEVFTDPSTGRLELAGAYLSGPVRDKLAAARRAAEKDPAFAVNVSALEAVQPTERTIGEFTPEMGAHWTPPELLQGFLREYLGDRTLRVAHDDRYGWLLYTGKVPQANNVLYGVPANEEKGTKGKTAVEIARSILGHGTLTIYRDDKRRHVDEGTSRLVRQKADQMRSDFAKYATANADRLTRLTDSYNTIMNGHVVRSYDGMSPSLDGFTPGRTPHAWQLSGAARMQFERSVVLAHEVGLGKTGTLVMGTQALKASGQIEKPFAVVPDHLAQQWYDEARFLYPNAEIHLITSGDLADGRRDSTLEWLRANKPDLVIFTEPAFGSIKMSPEAQDEYEFRELEALREQLDRQYEDADNPNHPFIVAKIEQRIATVQNRISKNAAPMRTPGETYWDDLGYDYAVVDEAHRYKGVGFRSREGGGDPATIRGIDLHQKLTDLHRRRDGRATVTLATGTPLSNSITEQYTMLALAAPWVLDAYKAGAPDLWAATFGRKTLRVENAPDGSGLRIVERFAEFHNRRAMKTMWGLIADTKRADDVGIPRPKIKGGGPNLILVDSTKDQAARLKKHVARGRAIHMGEPQQIRNRKGALVDDNMLTVSNEGTSVALDPRLVDPKAPAGNKLRTVAAKHVERYHRHKDRVYKTHYSPDGAAPDHPTPGALQMIFLNEGVPGGDNRGSFDAYAELRDLMVQGGIPAEKIAFVQDHKKSGKPEEIAELFRRARDGEIAVLIGSSSVAGTGMNAQNRMVSLTHVDLDWGAAQMEQRNGRILRYGNQNAEVEVDIFATKGSLDGWKAGFVASKAEGLIDIQRPEMSDSDTRDTVTELDVDYPDYETMEAEIGGNPYMSQLMKARRLLRDLEIDQHNEAAERVRRQEALADLHQEIATTRDGIARREEALPRIRVRDSFAMNLGGLSYTDRADGAAALHRQVTTQLLEHDRDGMSPWKVLGQFSGLDIGVRTEKRADGKLVAHVGFPDLARSAFERGPDDLKKKGAGSGMITRLTNALEKAPALQQADQAQLPKLDEQIALLQSAQVAADFTPQIEHARARTNLLDEVVGKIADLDKVPEIDENELDKKLTKAQRRKVVEERQETRVPLQGAVDAAILTLDEFDRKFPQPERAESPDAPDQREPEQDPVRLSAEEVSQTLDQLRPEGSSTDETADEPSTATDTGDHDDRDRTVPAPPTAPADEAPEEDGTVLPAPDRSGAVAQPGTPASEVDDSANESPADVEPGDTVTLDRDEVAQQLDAIRPAGSKAPSAMSEQEVADEIVALMEREMADGELSGADRTRMAVLEAENDRRAGRTPKSEPKKPAPAEPEGGLFDIDEPEPRAPITADPNNPLDRPDDMFGTPDLFADHEGRDTSRLRPVQMRNPSDLTEGDRYTDPNGRTHTVAEPPQHTGRGRVRIVTSDGHERFYNRDAELRLRYPDEEINDEPSPEPRDADTADDRESTALAAPQSDNDTTPEGTSDSGEEDEQQPTDDEQAQGGEEARDDQTENRDDDKRRRDRASDTDGAAPDGAPEGAGGGPQLPGLDRDQDDDSDAEDAEPATDDDRERRRRRRRGERGTDGGPDGPGGPGLPRPNGLPHLSNTPAGSPSADDGAEPNGAGPNRMPPRTVADLRNAWQRGDRLTEQENTSERRTFLAQLAENPALTLSSSGGLVTWTDDTAPDGMRRWQFAQARNGGRFGKITLLAANADDARDLADLFEMTTDANGQPIDWHQPLTPEIIDQWRDRQDRTLPEALRTLRDLFQDGEEPDNSSPGPTPATLPGDLTDLSDDDLAAAWGQGLSDTDQMRVAAEMDRRDNADQRVRDAIPSTPAADAEEVRSRGKAMDAALGFGTTDVTQRPRTREERLQQEFQEVDEARYSAALAVTNGYFFSNTSKRLPRVGERELFSSGNLSRFGRWRDYASEELIEWYDSNGGRLTYNQWKQKRRTDEKIERQEYEEEQRRAAATADASTPEGGGDATVPSIDDIDLPSFTLPLEAEEDANRRFGGADQVRTLTERADLRPTANTGTYDVWMNGRRVGTVRHANQDSDSEPMWDATPLLTINHDHNSRSASRDLAVANLVVRSQQNPTTATTPDEDSWNAVNAHLAGRNPELPGLPGGLSDDPEAKERYERIVRLVESFRAQQSPSGDLAQDLAHARDEFEWLRRTLATSQGPQQDQDALNDLERRSIWAERLRTGFGQDGSSTVDASGREPNADAPTVPSTPPGGSSDSSTGAGDQAGPAGSTPDAPDARRSTSVPRTEGASEADHDDSATARTPAADTPAPDAGPTREPRPAPEPVRRPEGAGEDVSEPQPRPEPEPIGGQPAHWASVDQLQPGDTARIDGTTRRGRAVTRVGYVLDVAKRVAVTRRGRTEDMLRTLIGERPDGRTGSRNTVYTPLNASAARAQAPDGNAPGAPISGAQGDVVSGDLPDTIATDTRGLGLFPGTHVTGSGDREGTVTGVTDTTVSVRWSDGDTDHGVAPSSLTAVDTEDQRPAGWTSFGQRVRPGHVVSDESGAFLGPVSEANGDRITVATTEGIVTRDVTGLRVTGVVRDDAPETTPVTNISKANADEINQGDIVVLDLDGAPTTVEVLDTNREGDRVTLDYVDTTTGELGTIDMDATAVIHKLEGPNGTNPGLGPDDAPAATDELTVHEPLPTLDPVTGPTVDPDLTPADRDAIADHGSSPEDDPNVQQAAVRIGADLPVTPEQATALAAQLRANADPATTEGRAALRAADHLDRAASHNAPEGLDRPRPSNAAQIGEGDIVAMPDERRGDEIHVYRVIDVEEGPGGVRSLLLEDENRQWKRRLVHAAMPVWQLPEWQPDESPSPGGTPPAAPADTPAAPTVPIARVRPGNLRVGDVIDAPVSRAGYTLNEHRRLTITSPPQHNGWWMQLTGVADDGTVHDFGLHNARAVDVYERNRTTPALPPSGTPRDPNPSPQAVVDRIVADQHRVVAARVIDEAVAGTEPPGDIHALREQIAQRLTPEALQGAREAARQDANAALDAAGITGRDRAAAQQALRQARAKAHKRTVRAALRTINDLEPLPGESNEDLAQRGADLLRLIPDQSSAPVPSHPHGTPEGGGSIDASAHVGDAVTALVRQLEEAGVDPADTEELTRLLTAQLDGTRQATARRIVRRGATSPGTARQPGILAHVLALLGRMARRLVELVKAAARKIAEMWRNNRDRLSRMKAFLGRLVGRVRNWPESRRLAQLHAALNLPSVEGETLASRVAQWANLLPEHSRFGQVSRRVSWWRPTTWAQLAAGSLPGRTGGTRWVPDRASDGGPGLTALRHMAALRAAGADVDQDVTRRLANTLGADFGGEPHATLRHADDYVAATERRLLNLQAARSSSTIQDQDVEVEIAAARMEAAAARREWLELRTQYAAAVPAAVGAALADVRDLGPQGNAGVVFGPDTTPGAERAVRTVQRHVPRDWLANADVRRLTAVDGEVGRYEAEARRATVADLDDAGVGTAAHALAQHLAGHLPDLDSAQRAFWYTRTHTGRPGARTLDHTALGRLLAQQQTQMDTGDSLARSMQSMFTGDWYEDDDLRAFLLGLLATR